MGISSKKTEGHGVAMQSKRGSTYEVAFNYFIGIITANLIWLYIVIPWSPILGWNFHHEAHIGRVTSVNILFTVTSVIRPYGVRRLFNWLNSKHILN